MTPRRCQLESYRLIRWCVVLAAVLAISGCNELEKPKTEPFYSQTAPPQKRELRWSNGKLPKSFDPAMAASAPETDIVRAIFDGLTENHPKTLGAMPSIALRWEGTDSFKTWTFHLRKDVRWSNGDKLTARDFVASWERVARMGSAVPQRRLLSNIVGAGHQHDGASSGTVLENEAVVPGASPDQQPVANRFTNQRIETEPSTPNPSPSPSPKAAEPKLGVEAPDAYTLRVSLVHSDPDFPALVAHPVFRPVHAGGKNIDPTKLDAGIVTSGPFRISSVGPEGVTLDRTENYWDRETVELDRVRFVPIDSAEKALEGYRLGELDVVTNAHFEPLALKLLKPFEDFRQTTYGALNFYEFNTKKPPFDDRRVREALTIAIERERLTDGEMEGSTRPAFSYLPYGPGEKQRFKEDADRARELLEQAGFPGGASFPTVRLVVNRNNVQQRVARLVAKIWDEQLKIKTEVIAVEAGDVERIRSMGEFDLVRRGVVLPSSDETTSLLTIFAPPKMLDPEPSVTPSPATDGSPADLPSQSPTPAPAPEVPEVPDILLTHESAIDEVPAIPLYFPTSYSLVKPYVVGFEINVLDSPSLKRIRIDTGWQPRKPKGES